MTKAEDSDLIILSNENNKNKKRPPSGERLKSIEIILIAAMV
jgi:hypothetical protein